MDSEYYNIPASFDIETTSTYQGKDKVAFMYVWSFCIEGYTYYGRTWEEFLNTMDTLIDELSISLSKRFVIYVHNLSYEFQFIRKYIKWEKVFCASERKVIYALAKNGIEFRCSNILSGYSLAVLADNLTKFQIKKLVGNLDYNLVRHSETPLTNDELEYCLNDVRIVVAFIHEELEKYRYNITKLPLTKTGYVREYCREMCYHTSSKDKKAYYEYSNLMSSLQLQPSEYLQLKRAFQGGFTHSNAFHTGMIMHNVKSYDFTSSYPYVMMAEQFPMSKGRRVSVSTESDFRKYLQNFACMFDIVYHNIKPKDTAPDHIISLSKCFESTNETTDNGRIVTATRIKLTITEIDFQAIELFYDYTSYEVSNLVIYYKGYLPTDFVKSIVKLYKDKTELKGVEGKEVEYSVSKGMINACYGMSVTDIVRNEITYSEDDEWGVQPGDIESTIKSYNKSKKRFIYYPWGVWITAYARWNLYRGILEFGDDYIYSDTDSLKVINYEKHEAYIKLYQQEVIAKLKKAAEYHGIDFEDFQPQTIKGEKKLIGVWTDEGIYSRFKTLGAKRYMYEDKYGVHITIAGLGKCAVKYMMDKFGDKIFEYFDDDMRIPAEHTGKNTHTYIDTAQRGEVIDYLGKKGSFSESSSVHLENAEFTLNIAEQYAEYLKGMVK